MQCRQGAHLTKNPSITLKTNSNCHATDLLILKTAVEGVARVIKMSGSFINFRQKTTLPNGEPISSAPRLRVIFDLEMELGLTQDAKTRFNYRVSSEQSPRVSLRAARNIVQRLLHQARSFRFRCLRSLHIAITLACSSDNLPIRRLQLPITRRQTQ